MNNREEFEKLFLILYKKWGEWGKHTSAYGVGWDIWQEQQKIIDELNLKLAIKNDMITALNLTVDELKAKNPDVPCPVCGGSGGIASCPTCNHTGTVPLTKAQEYRIRELEAEIKNYQDVKQNIAPIYVNTDIYPLLKTAAAH